MRVLLVLLPLVLLTGCRSVMGTFHAGDELTWEQYISIRPGMTAAEIREIYGEPNEERIIEGRVVRFTYLAWDEPEAWLRTVDLEFDEQGVLVKKSLW